MKGSYRDSVPSMAESIARFFPAIADTALVSKIMASAVQLALGTRGRRDQILRREAG